MSWMGQKRANRFSSTNTSLLSVNCADSERGRFHLSIECLITHCGQKLHASSWTSDCHLNSPLGTFFQYVVPKIIYWILYWDLIIFQYIIIKISSKTERNTQTYSTSNRPPGRTSRPLPDLRPVSWSGEHPGSDSMLDLLNLSIFVKPKTTVFY